jgi:hypothetical protein
VRRLLSLGARCHADHWTTATTLNEGSTSRDDADAKFEPFNSMLVHAFLAVWPDDGELEPWGRGVIHAPLSMFSMGNHG